MACAEDTPPPEAFQDWYDELYADLPNLPDDVEDCLRSKYDFRTGVRENIKTPITDLDQDESGTFDPACKKQPECIPIGRKRRERRERIDDGIPKKLKTSTWQGGRWSGRQLPVVLTFTSDNGRAALKTFGTSLDNLPRRLPDPESSDDSPTDWPEFQNQPYDLRERRRFELSDPASAARIDGLHLEDITLGYPAYRGCKLCFEWGFRCPLLDEGSRYPCAECHADNAECELIVEPAVKRICEGCRSRRQQCSYREEGTDHTKACQQCTNAGRKCVAGPASGRTRTGPSLDQGAPRPRKQKAQIRKRLPRCRRRNGQPQSPKISCTQCTQRLQDKEWCSQIDCKGQIECRHHCHGLVTDTVASAASKSVTSKNEKEKANEVCGLKPSKPAAAEQTEAIRYRTITTKLAHPIQFNYAFDDDESTAPCHWCEDEIYGILGLGRIEVGIIDSEDGQGFIEVVGGHTATYGHSRMCEFCTTDRLKVTACPNHCIEPIEGMDPENFDYKAVMEWMMPGMASLAPFKWCSICPSPAFFSCSTKTEIELDGQVEDIYPGDHKGCGLFLCESCAVTLVNETEGKLDRLIDGLEDDSAGEGFGIRADASFLHSDGELLRRMQGYASTFIVESMGHTDDKIAPLMFTEDITIPGAKVGNMGDFMALNVYLDNKDATSQGASRKKGAERYERRFTERVNHTLDSRFCK